MSWVPDLPEYSWFERLCIQILKCGTVPKHVAFIMDGNRRFARENGIAKIDGHTQGFDKLAETLQWCNDFGIKEVTVYAFSIENFKRPQEEVDGLLDLAREKFKRIIDERKKLEDFGVRINILGKISLLPPDLQELILQAQKMTSAHRPLTLNIAFSYTAREEMAQAIRLTSEAVKDGILEEEDITEAVLERCLYTRFSPQPELLIRTSGEVRLSDFLLWQSAFSVTFFTKVLWPDFMLKNLIQGVFYFQLNHRQIESAQRISLSSTNCSSSSEERIEKFLRHLEADRQRTLALTKEPEHSSLLQKLAS